MTIPQRPRQEEKAGAVLTVFRCRFRLRASCANVLNNWGTPKLQDCQRIQTTSEYLGRILGGISNSLSWQMITWFLEFSAGKWRKRLPKRRGSWNSWALSTPGRVVQLELGHLWRSNDLDEMWILHVLLKNLHWIDPSFWWLKYVEVTYSIFFAPSNPWTVPETPCSAQCAWFWLWSPQDAEKKRREKAL